MKYTKRKDGRYECGVTLGYDETGKQIIKHLYAKTIRELEEKRAKYIVKKPNYTPKADVTVEEYASRWLSYKSNITAGTLKIYQVALNNYIVKTYGMRPLNSITKADIQSLINDNFSSWAVCHKIKITFKQLLDLAMDENIVDKNVCYNIKMPPKEKPEKRALTEDETHAILNAPFSHMERLFVDVLYFFGLRRGEALALTSSDFSEEYLTINKSLASIDNQGVVKEPKTKNSIRKIPIPAEFKKRHPEITAADYLFKTPKGELYHDARFRYFWKHIKEKIEAELGYKTDITCHTFRHNYCTLCYYNFTLLQTKELMGHADEKMIMEVYAHLDSKRENLIEKINRMF